MNKFPENYVPWNSISEILILIIETNTLYLISHMCTGYDVV